MTFSMPAISSAPQASRDLYAQMIASPAVVFWVNECRVVRYGLLEGAELPSFTVLVKALTI